MMVDRSGEARRVSAAQRDFWLAGQIDEVDDRVTTEVALIRAEMHEFRDFIGVQMKDLRGVLTRILWALIGLLIAIVSALATQAIS